MCSNVYIQQDATLHILLYLETAHQERKQLYLQHLVFATPLLHVEQFPDKINRVMLHRVGYILEYSYNAQSHER